MPTRALGFLVTTLLILTLVYVFRVGTLSVHGAAVLKLKIEIWDMTQVPGWM